MNDKKRHGVFKITPITPIHISDGEKYQIFEYYIDDNKNFYLKDVMKFFQDNFEDYDTALKIIEDLSFRPGPEYIRYTLPVYTELKKTEKNLSFSSPQKTKKQLRSISSKHTSLSSEQIKIQKQSNKQHSQNYQSKISSQESTFQFIKEVLSFIKDPFGNFFIPGSSLKGCIRNAVINSIIKSVKCEQSFFTEIVNNRLPKIEKYTTLEGNDFDSDAKYDLFKFLTVRDSKGIPISNFGVCQIKVKSKNNNKSFSSKNYNIFAECLVPTEKKIDVEFYIDKQALELMFGRCKPTNKEIDYLKDIFTNKEKFNDSLSKYSDILIKEQLQFFNSVDSNEYFIPQQIKTKKDNEIFLQLGYGTSSISKTITVLFSQQERIQLANILNWGKSNYSESMPYPKSRKLTTSKENMKTTLPMGWFKLEIDWA